MNYSHSEIGDMLARIAENLTRHGIEMPAVNATNVTLGDLVAVLDRMVAGPPAQPHAAEEKEPARGVAGDQQGEGSKEGSSVAESP